MQLQAKVISLGIIFFTLSAFTGASFSTNYDVNSDTSCFNQQWDFIIVGGGTAGSVLANRLSANSAVRVLMLEAGGPSQRATGSKEGGTFKYKLDDNGGFQLDGSWTRYDVPLLLSSIFLSSLDPRSSRYQEYVINGYPSFQAKVLGGSGVHNGMLWYRAIPQNFANWGVNGWSYNEMLPFFKKSESVNSTRVSQPNNFHGFTGPIQISDPAIIEPDAPIFCNATLNTSPNYKYIPDFNGDNTVPLEGCGYVYHNIRRGVRDSAVVAYLFNTDVITRPNLVIRANTQVIKVIFNYAKVATGVKVIDSLTGTSYTLTANKAVILSAGAMNTPKVLLQSGIGPAADLAALGIPVVYNNPNVGRGIRNNPTVNPVWAVANESHPNFFNLANQAVQYAVDGTGMYADTGFNEFALFRTLPTLTVPDVFIYGQPGNGPNLYGNLYTLPLSITDPPFADGYVKLLNNNATSNNIYYFQNYSTPAHAGDVATLVRGIKVIRNIMRHPPANTYFVNEIAPGAAYQTDAQLTAWVTANIGEQFHYASSAKMGNIGDPLAVVDNHCRVLGVSKLLIVDASILPNSTHGFIHATVVAVAERAAALIISDFGL